MLTQEDKALAAEREQLLIDKSLHIKETMRIRAEDNSKFNDFRILGDRYLLTKLLGKGGFSEVYKAYDLLELRVRYTNVIQSGMN